MGASWGHGLQIHGEKDTARGHSAPGELEVVDQSQVRGMARAQ